MRTESSRIRFVSVSVLLLPCSLFRLKMQYFRINMLSVLYQRGKCNAHATGIIDCLAGDEIYQVLEADLPPAEHFETCTETFKAVCFLIVGPSGRNMPRYVGTNLSNKIDDVKLLDAQGLVFAVFCTQGFLKKRLLMFMTVGLYRDTVSSSK